MQMMQQCRILMEQIDYIYIKQIDEQIGTPFYLMDSNLYRQNIMSFLEAFKRRYNNIIAGYSFKTNYVPALCNMAKSCGCYAEVVSKMEFELAQKIGFENIIFNGPIKTPDALEKAIAANAIINLDSEYEVDFVCEYKRNHKECNPRIGLRININLTDSDGNSTIQCGLRFGRFGFPKDILKKNIERLSSAGIKIIALHGHTSSSDRAVINYHVISQKMLEVVEEFCLYDIQFFDIGGGYFGAAPKGLDLTGRPKYEDYANIVLDEVLRNEWFVEHKPFIVIEPGSSVVSNVFKYVSKLYQNKHIGEVNFVTTDGTVFDVKPTLHSNNLPHKVFTQKDTAKTLICDVVGSTCMEKDVILKQVELPIVEHGDYLMIDGVGAYSIALTPTFINFLSPIVEMSEKGIRVVRRRQCIDDVINLYTI